MVDISHASFEEQVEVANQTLAEIGCADKPTIMVFNKIDAYSHVEKDPFDLAPPTKENITLDELKNTWMAKVNAPAIFISAKERINLDELRKLLYEEVKKLHVIRYPYNSFLY
jgi:GTP-binding protein HflX